MGGPGQPIQGRVFAWVCVCVCVCPKQKFGCTHSVLSPGAFLEKCWLAQRGTNVCATRWDEIFISGYNLRACMCWGCEACSHQYHPSALPLTGISIPSEEITVLSCPSCIFMLVYYNGHVQNELGITKLTCNANRQNAFDVISLSMTLPT